MSADFGFKTSQTFRERTLVPFFRHHLKSEGDFDLPEAWVSTTGRDADWAAPNNGVRIDRHGHGEGHAESGEGVSFEVNISS